MRAIVSEYVAIFRTYEALLEYRKRLCMEDDQHSIALCEIYAIWWASKIVRLIRSIVNLDARSIRKGNINASDLLGIRPDAESIGETALGLLHALDFRDEVAVLNALQSMGVLAFCSESEQVFERIEGVISRLDKRVWPLYLVDISLFAVEAGDFERAGEYARQAIACDPSSRELYDLRVIEGLVALNGGMIGEAIRYLDNSAQASQTDVDSSVQCALLPPNLELAGKLLRIGERIAVVRHLLECHNVWQSERPRIDEWIRAIECGENPDFQVAGGPVGSDRLTHRLKVRWMRACSLDMHLTPAKSRTQMSAARVLAERDARMAEHMARMDAHISRKLAYLDTTSLVLTTNTDIKNTGTGTSASAESGDRKKTDLSSHPSDDDLPPGTPDL